MSKPRETLYPLVGDFISGIVEVAVDGLASLIVMDEKSEGAAIAQARRCRRRGDQGVKIINPFGILRTPEEPGAGCNPLTDLDRHGPLARKRREVSGRRRKGRGGAAPNEDGDG